MTVPEDSSTAKRTAAKATIQHKLTNKDYIVIRQDLMRMIRNKDHQMSSARVNNISLSPYDDKRHVLKDGVVTLAYGHNRIEL